MNRNTKAKKITASVETITKDVENTVWGFSSSLLENRKNVVSIPKVSITNINAT